jgi:hypothetical protein
MPWASRLDGTCLASRLPDYEESRLADLLRSYTLELVLHYCYLLILLNTLIVAVPYSATITLNLYYIQ